MIVLNENRTLRLTEEEKDGMSALDIASMEGMFSNIAALSTERWVEKRNFICASFFEVYLSHHRHTAIVSQADRCHAELEQIRREQLAARDKEVERLKDYISTLEGLITNMAESHAEQRKSK